MSAPSPAKRDILISKSLSYLLRHGAVKEHLPIDSHGWVPLSNILQHNRMKTNKVTLEDIERIVASNDKQRFKIDDSGSRICATQGHSLSNIGNDNLTLLTPETLPAAIYHGTYRAKLSTIVQSGGLSRMRRNHVHFTSNENDSISGIRHNCNVLVYVDGPKAMQEGHLQFYKSQNGVILCSGDATGTVGVEYWSKVVDLGTNEEIDISSLKK